MRGVSLGEGILWMIRGLHRFACRDCRMAWEGATHRWPASGHTPPRLGAADSSSGCMEAHRIKFLPKKCSTEVAWLADFHCPPHPIPGDNLACARPLPASHTPTYAHAFVITASCARALRDGSLREGSVGETTGDLGDNGLRNVASRSPEALRHKLSKVPLDRARS